MISQWSMCPLLVSVPASWLYNNLCSNLEYRKPEATVSSHACTPCWKRQVLPRTPESVLLHFADYSKATFTTEEATKVCLEASRDQEGLTHYRLAASGGHTFCSCKMSVPCTCISHPCRTCTFVIMVWFWGLSLVTRRQALSARTSHS